MIYRAGDVRPFTCGCDDLAALPCVCKLSKMRYSNRVHRMLRVMEWGSAELGSGPAQNVTAAAQELRIGAEKAPIGLSEGVIFMVI